MNPNPSPCENLRIDGLLDDQLDVVVESQVIAHLETCEVCRQRVSAAAADEDSWSEAECFLKNDEFDLELLRDERSDQLSRLKSDQSLSFLAPTDDPQMLGRLGPYEISGVIGSGGMGIVLKGFDGALDRVVAIKVLSQHLAASGAARQRFAREAKAIAAVHHPNVIAVHAVSESMGLPYLVMPYNRGESLERRLQLRGALETLEVVRIAYQVAAGLAAAHKQGLVHRDIKPANILLEDGVERVTITDFGLARAVDDATVTQTGYIVGTPQYMSPEQARGERIDERSDLFSLGSVMYAMCAGRAPFRATSCLGVVQRINSETPHSLFDLNPRIPSWLVNLIKRLHEKSPEHRFQSAIEVERVLARCLLHLEQPETNPTPAELNETLAMPSNGHFVRRAGIVFFCCFTLASIFAISSPRLWHGGNATGETLNSSESALEAEGHEPPWRDAIDDAISDSLVEIERMEESFQKTDLSPPNASSRSND